MDESRRLVLPRTSFIKKYELMYTLTLSHIEFDSGMLAVMLS